MANFYYIGENEQKQGPYDWEQIQQLVQQGKIIPNTLIENEAGKSGLARNMKDLVFPESTPVEPTQKPVTSDPESFVDTPPETESLPITSRIPEGCECISEPGAAQEEPIRDTIEQSDTLATPDTNEEGKAATVQSAPDEVPSELKPTLETLEGKLDTLIDKFATLIGSVDFGTKFAEKKQAQIDKLYEENQKYKEGIHEKLKKSLVLAVIGQIDAAQKTISHFGNQEFSEENYGKLLDNYNEIATDFQDALAQSFDVTAFSNEENTPFDAKLQRALKTVSTDDETKHKTINKSLRQGYEIVNADGTTTLLRLEMVEVYVYQTPQGEKTTETN